MMTLNIPRATYVKDEYIRLDGLSNDGYISLTIIAAKALHAQLAAILYGTQDEPKKIA